MRRADMRDTGWVRSTRSGGATDNCVEVRVTDEGARVRDSKNPGVVITADLEGLLSAVTSGRFDRRR
jgi:Domain of unknown function (DUF397)